MLGSVTSGVVANFVYDQIKDRAPEKLRKTALASFFGGNAPLDAIEGAYQNARRELLDRHPDKAIQLFLSPEKNLKGGLLDPLLQNIFFGNPLRTKQLDRNLRSCFDTYVDDSRIQHIIDDIDKTIKRHLLATSEGSGFALNSAIYELRRVTDTINASVITVSDNVKSIAAAIPEASGILEFSKAYHKSLRQRLEAVMINGLDMVSKREKVIHSVSDSYVPLRFKDLTDIETLRAPSIEGKLDIARIIGNVRNAVIRGPAGSGKTTLFQRLAYVADPFSKKSETSMGFFPIFIQLRRLQSEGVTNYSVGNVIDACMPDESLRRQVPLQWLEKLESANVDVLFLIDGIDEVPANRRGDAWKFVSDLSKSFPQFRLLISSRHVNTVHLSDGSYRPDIFDSPESYRKARLDWAKPNEFFEFIVSPLSDGQVRDLIDRWYKGVDKDFVQPSERENVGQYPINLKEILALNENAHTLSICRTPLMCSLTCLVYLIEGGTLPKSHRQIYDYSAQLLIDTRDGHRGVEVPLEFKNFTKTKRVELLRHLALIMQEGAKSQLTNEQSVEARKDDVEKWIDSWLEKNKALTPSAEDHLEFLINRCSLLRESTPDHIDFIHRSFMEYFAAEEISYKRVVRQMRSKIEKEEWHNTLMFCMNTSGAGPQFGLNLICDMIDHIHGAEYPGKRGADEKRKDIIRCLSFLSAMTQVPEIRDGDLTSHLQSILPIRNLTEASDLRGVPFRILEAEFQYTHFKERYGAGALKLAAIYLAEHQDEDTKFIIHTGYGEIDDVEVIETLNHSQKIDVVEHKALFQRIKNGSYVRPIYVDIEALSNREFRSRVHNLRSLWLKFPIDGEKFVGWDFLARIGSMKLEGLTQEDLNKLVSSYNIWRFDECKFLQISRGDVFDFEALAELFPNVEEVSFDNSVIRNSRGLGELINLKQLLIDSCPRSVAFSLDHFPPNCEQVLVTRSVAPRIDDRLRSKFVLNDQYGVS